MTPEEQKAAQGFTWLFAAGLFAGLGALLASKETLTLRVIVGRAISSSMLGVGAGKAALIFFPALPLEAQFGICCLAASLGTSGVERIIQKWRG